MEGELSVLYALLFLALVLGPTITNDLFLHGSKSYQKGHIAAVLIVITAVLFNVNPLVVVWPLFCVAGLLMHLRNRVQTLLTLQTIVTSIPFVFSTIAAVWLFCGSNDLYLLGYDKYWSFYAALHGNYLGWLYLGCLAHLSVHRETSNHLYALGCLVGFALFLMVAFGINGIPLLKSIGAIGLSILVPCCILLFSIHAKRRISTWFCAISLLAILFSMGLALMNEFWVVYPPTFLGVRSMVTLHGVLNAVVVIPLFYIAIRLDTNAAETFIEERSS